MQTQRPVSKPVIAGLLHSLQWFAERETNAVLELLKSQSNTPARADESVPASIPELIIEQHYPDPPLKLLNSRMLAFYHYHEKPFCYDDEHGHFHIFVQRPGSTKVSHLVGMSINPQGQPVRWFTVNQWVTGGIWRAAQELVDELGHLSLDVDDTAVNHEVIGGRAVTAQWLISMLLLYRQEIDGLLMARDQRLLEYSGGDKADGGCGEIIAEAGKNRDIYILSECGIDLTERLHRIMAEGDQQT